VFKYGEDIVRIDPPDEVFEGALSDVHAESDRDYWVASRFGALHFDGTGWEVFDRRQGLPTEHFIRVAGGRGGVIWFGTFDSGILGYTGRNWIHHTTETGLSDNKIDDLVVDKNGDLWVITATGEVNRLHDGHFEDIALPRELAKRSIEAASDSLQEMDAFIRFLSTSEMETDPGSAAGKLVTGLDGPGNILLADYHGIYRFRGSDWQVIELPEGFGTIRPTSVMGSTRGRIWLGTEDKGVFVRSRTGWSRIESLDGLYDLQIRSLIQDRSGDIWIGTRTGGISRFTPTS
jgi:ligand-binding sensor domain-containing protein